jgi:hypothetical protein
VLVGAMLGILGVLWIDFEWLENVIVKNVESNRIILVTALATLGHFGYSIGSAFWN